jgi:hypothetical protein
MKTQTDITYASAGSHYRRSFWSRLTTDDWVGVYAGLILAAFLGICLGYVKPAPQVSSCYTSTPARR